ncbi:MAG: sensor histidine kinase [Ktedonobacterales bacterium]
MNRSHSRLKLAALLKSAGSAKPLLLVAACGVTVMPRRIEWWRDALDALRFRHTYELGPTIQRFSQELGALREQDDVVNLLLDGLVETLNLRGAAFVGLPEGLDPDMLRLIEPDDLRARRDFASPAGSLAVLRGLLSVDPAASRLSWGAPLLLDPWPGCAALVLIGPARGGLGLGLLVVGHKRTGRALHRNDRTLLMTLAHQAGTALENAVLVAGLKTSLAQVEVSTKQLVEARAEQQLLLRELVNADERQRAALARDLHDDALQEVLYLIRHARLGVELVTALETAGDTSRDLAALEPSSWSGTSTNTALTRLRTELAQLAERSVVVEQRLRALCMGLYPALLHSLGLPAALEDLAHDYAMSTSLRVTLDVPNDVLDAAEALDLETALHVYRIAQESLRNASKHAGASSALMRLALVNVPVPAPAGHHAPAHAVLQVVIEDDGRGLPLPVDYAALLRAGHLGLAGMRERAQRIGGMLAIRGAASGGTAIRLLVPINRDMTAGAAFQAQAVQHTHDRSAR